MNTGILKVALVDVVLLVFAYLVFQNLYWRDNYDAFRGYSVSTSFSLLIRRLELSSTSKTLVSPPTLDWIQVVIALLIIVNIVYVFGVLRSPKSAEKGSH